MEEEEEEEPVHQKEVHLPTVEDFSEWHLLPPQRSSMQTQTDPVGKGRQKERKKGEKES